MSEQKKYKCGACGEIVPYGQHCSKVPNGDLTLDKAHMEYANKNHHLYEEIEVKP
jgi:hypothetical protein